MKTFRQIYLHRLPYYLLLVIIFFVVSFNATAQTNDTIKTFTGLWSNAKEDLMFTLDLFQVGDSIKGYHCGITRNANRIDCSQEGEVYGFTITGTVDGNVAYVNFKSTYSNATGEAIITRYKDFIHWKIVSNTEGEFYLPMDEILK